MSKTTTISFNVSTEVKARLQKMASQYGITISDLMRMSALKVADEGIMIEPALKPMPYLEKLIQQTKEDLADNQNVTSFDSAKDAIKHLRDLSNNVNK